jgi:3-oxoacyl-[acyl-carrier protein] reductase
VDLGLANATAVVVGGSRGMGLAAARCLAEDGARVALVGRTRARSSPTSTSTVVPTSPDFKSLGLVRLIPASGSSIRNESIKPIVPQAYAKARPLQG